MTLTVRDTGVGIPDDELPHIFERFHRVESTRGPHLEGTGIGLALVQELVRLHGGSVTPKHGRARHDVRRDSVRRDHLPPTDPRRAHDRLDQRVGGGVRRGGGAGCPTGADGAASEPDA